MAAQAVTMANTFSKFLTGYIVLGFSQSVDGDLTGAPAGNKSWVLKLDSTGNIEWQQYFANIYYPSNIQQTPDSGYILGGDQLTKLNPDGSINWQHNDTSYYVLQTYDGGYALFIDDKITKLSAGLNTEWSYHYRTDTAARYYYNYSGIQQAPDSGFVFGGSWADKADDENIRGSWIVKTDKDGIAEINKENDDFKYIYTIKPDLDGNFIAGGSYRGAGLTSEDERIMGCDSSEIWYESTWGRNVYDVIQNIDSTYVDCGDVDALNMTNAYLVKRGADGVSIITLEYGGTDIDMLSMVLGTKDTGYIAIGYTHSTDGDIWGNHGQSDMWIMKFKQDTTVHVPEVVPVVSAKNHSSIERIQVYPNPTTGIVNITLPRGLENGTFGMYNIIGQSVDIKVTGKGQNRSIELKDQPPGQYILQVRQGAEQKSFRVTLTP